MYAAGIDDVHTVIVHVHAVRTLDLVSAVFERDASDEACTNGNVHIDVNVTTHVRTETRETASKLRLVYERKHQSSETCMKGNVHDNVKVIRHVRTKKRYTMTSK